MLTISIDEKNPKLKEKYMIFANDYIDRATQIKKTYLSTEQADPSPKVTIKRPTSANNQGKK